MATRFELVLEGDSESHLRAAGGEALDEIERLDRQLSFYRPESDVSEINRRAAYEPVRIDPRLFELLAQARSLAEDTGGAFDITVAPLMRCWGLAGGEGRVPADREITEVMEKVGYHHLHLDRASYTVQFDRPGVEIDLGAIGKGYAIGRAVELLQANGVASALLHGGTSTIYAIGDAAGESGWRVAVRAPSADSVQEQLVELVMRDRALSVSAPHGKFFVQNSRSFGHVIDSRSGRPCEVAASAAVVLADATETDALSTALLVRGADWLPDLRLLKPEVQAMVFTCAEPGGLTVSEVGWSN